MSFDIHLNVFSPDYDWAARVDEARFVLDRFGARANVHFHCHLARWEDGSGLAIYSRSLFDASAGFAALLTPLGGMSLRFCDFTYEFALVVGCAIYPDVIPPVTLAVNPQVVAGLPARLAASKVIRVSSGVAVRDALSDSYRDWRGIVRRTARELDKLTQDRPTGAE